MAASEYRSERLLEATEEDDAQKIAGILSELDKQEDLDEADRLNLALAHRYTDENGKEGLKRIADDIFDSQYQSPLTRFQSVPVEVASGFTSYMMYTEGWNAVNGMFDDILAFMAGAYVGQKGLRKVSKAIKKDEFSSEQFLEEGLGVDGTYFPESEYVREVRQKLDQEYGIDTYGP